MTTIADTMQRTDAMIASNRELIAEIDGILKCRHGLPLIQQHKCPECVVRAKAFDAEFVTRANEVSIRRGENASC